MNENTTKLIAELATKLGITADHLWMILVRQAHISATTDLLVTIGSAVAIVVCGKGIQRLMKTESDNDDIAACVFVVIGLFGLVAACVLICGLTSLDMTMAGFFNPEYWAFKHIVK